MAAKTCERCFLVSHVVQERTIKGKRYTVCNKCALDIATGK